MVVVPYSSDVLCTHKTRRQLLYTDVQQLKMVQMVSQHLIILRFLSMLSDGFTLRFFLFYFFEYQYAVVTAEAERTGGGAIDCTKNAFLRQIIEIASRFQIRFG